MNVLALDPSITCSGVSVVRNEDDVILFGSAVKMRDDCDSKHMGRMKRCHELYNELAEIIDTYCPGAIVSEAPTGSMSASAAASLGIIRGFVQGIASSLHLPIVWVHESRIKIDVVDDRSADKIDIMKSVMDEMNVPKVGSPKEGAYFTGVKYRDEAIADSLAVYLTVRDELDFNEFVESGDTMRKV